MVEGCARAGATVVVSSRKQDLCDEVAAEIAEATGATVHGVACHVGDWDSIPAMRGRLPRTHMENRTQIMLTATGEMSEAVEAFRSGRRAEWRSL